MQMAEASSLRILSAPPGGPKNHFAIDVAFPVYALDFISDQIVVLGGGGGSSRTGVKNRLSAWRIDADKRDLQLVQEHELSKEEDAPMSMAVESRIKELVVGINSSAETLARGINENVRIFTYNDEGISFQRAKQTLASTNEDHYQKCTAFNRTSPSLIAIGSTNSQLSILTYPGLDNALPPIFYDGDEVYDVDFDDSGEMLVGTSAKKLCIWSLRDVQEGVSAEPLQIIERPILRKALVCTFRAAKFGRVETKENIYTVVNAVSEAKNRKGSANDRKAFVSLWNTRTWKLMKTRTVSQRPITAFDVSLDGRLLAFGSSDLSIGILDAKRLSSLLTVLSAHSFPVTTLRFCPSSDLVISGSVDNSIRVVKLPANMGHGSRVTLWLCISILIMLLAIALQYRLAGGDPSIHTPQLVI